MIQEGGDEAVKACTLKRIRMSGSSSRRRRKRATNEKPAFERTDINKNANAPQQINTQVEKSKQEQATGGETLYLQLLSTNTYITYFYSNILMTHVPKQSFI